MQTNDNYKVSTCPDSTAMSMIVHLYICLLTISKIFLHSMHAMHQEMRQISVKDDPNEDDARSIDASVAAVALQIKI